MVQKQTKTLKMMYKNRFKYIDCPRNAKYEECIEIALDRFNIPEKNKKFIQISNEFNNIFDEQTFEYYNLLFPNPEIIFFIKIDCEGLKNKKQTTKRKPLGELNIKRKRCSVNGGLSGQIQNNCSEEIYEIERQNSDEPPTKKSKLFFDKPKTSWWNLFLNKLFD
ncbi:uncharacterized protein LOC129911808 [Episyrphus balteatus]|uniref:uncharacterized protein LOC129911808 n=1 Tax=Episyrphus balteatus TaxID=286459 RepID=UPI0024853D02|nr:uncharacterized protein LOC129911808 [Episyrphus balteatus]